MSTTLKVRIDIPVLLPDLPDARDACVERLTTMLASYQGVSQAHVGSVDSEDESTPGNVLCLHYDPDVITLARLHDLARSTGAVLTARFGHEVFSVRVIGSEDSGRGMEQKLRSLTGVVSASVNLPAQRVQVEWDRELVTDEVVQQAVESLGTGAPTPVAGNSCCGPRDPAPPAASWYRRNQELVWSLIALSALALAWGGERWLALPRTAALALYLTAYAFGAWDLTRHWVTALRRGQLSFDIDLLMLVAALGAAVLGQWAEGAFLLGLFSLAHALEHYANDRARRAISALADLAPSTARVRRGDSIAEVAVESVAVGEIVLVRPGERIPVDGDVASGSSAVNQAPITGESVPVEKAAGDPVYAGTVNGDGAMEVATSRRAGDRTLDRVIKLVEEAQTQKAPTQRFTERFERVFVPVVLIADVLLIVVPALFGWWTWSESLYRGMSLLVAASPCALALGTPSAVLAGIAQAARHGVLVKGGMHLENLGIIRALAFDKTGTLTEGRPEVTDVLPSTGVTAEELLAIAGSVETESQHPLAAAVVRRASKDGIALQQAGALESVTGRGVRSSVAGERVEIGTLKLWQDGGVTVPGEIVEKVATLQAGGRSIVVIRKAEKWLGVLGIADQPRKGVRAVLDRLRGLGVSPLVMLTGDNKGVGDAIAREVGVDEVRSELLPEDKVVAVKALLATHRYVAMIGDGVNDAPALAHATVGIAMGGIGSATALETADVALMGDDLSTLPFAIGLSRESRRVIRQNLYISLGTIVLLILSTSTGLIGIGLAVVGHEGSTLLVIANALRLLRYRRGLPVQAH
ncbi:MAG: heavy metal translocating P-type ATPase [Gemmatimonadota bacterium]